MLPKFKREPGTVPEEQRKTAKIISEYSWSSELQNNNCFIIPTSAQFFNTLKTNKLFKILLHVSTILSSSGSNLLPR